jgi:hypothetical protein
MGHTNVVPFNKGKEIEMAKSLKDVLASSEQVAIKAGVGGNPMVAESYPTDLLWAVAAKATASIEGAVMYDGRDDFQLAFISTRPPGSNPQRNAPKPQQVTIYRSGRVVFNRVAIIDPTSFSEAELAAGQLFAQKAGHIELDEAEIKALTKTVETA